jgi:hypothetical protein
MTDDVETSPDDVCVCEHRRGVHTILGPKLARLKKNADRPHLCDRCDCRKFEASDG